MTAPRDARWMASALAIADRAMGQTWPNPAVGCVIVKDGKLLARAATAPGGRPHAEPQAIALAGPACVGATAYVTLEPCAHTGQTGPCCDALIAARVARVVIACSDPDPRVNGQGIERMRAAGIEITTGVLADKAKAQLAGFLKRVETGRPKVTLKLAASFDGRIATASGQSQWITGPQARAHVHAMRARHDAVMVGAGTARADDPTLTVRGMGPRRQPVRIVVSRCLDLPAASNLTRTTDQAPLWLCHGPGADTEPFDKAGIQTIACEVSGGQIDPNDLLQQLGFLGLTRIYCEGGGALAASMLQAGLVDEVHGYTAGLMIGAEGTPGLGMLGIGALSDAPRFELAECRPLGGDLFHRWIKT